MSILDILNSSINIGYYLITAFLLFAIVKSFIKSKNIQDSIVYCLIMIPFVLRLLRLK